MLPVVSSRISVARIKEAAGVIDPLFLLTPQFVCEPLSDELGVRVLLKIETLNPIRCFKGRGADYFVSRMPAGERLICASAGNFGQAMAYACRKRGISLNVFASVKTNPLKLDRMRALGAEVVLYGDDFDDAKLASKRVAAETSVPMVEDGLEPAIAEGAGTIGLELAESRESFYAVLVPVGNGAMIAGVGCALKSWRPGTKVIAVQADGAPAMVESWRSGHVVEHETMNTIADGVGVRVPIPEAVEDMRAVVDDAVLVREQTILRAMRLLHRRAGVVVEPSGAVGLAAILERPEMFRGATVATIVGGGNVTPEQMDRWL